MAWAIINNGIVDNVLLVFPGQRAGAIEIPPAYKNVQAGWKYDEFGFHRPAIKPEPDPDPIIEPAPITNMELLNEIKTDIKTILSKLT